MFFFFFSSRRRHTRFSRDWSSDVCSSDLPAQPVAIEEFAEHMKRSKLTIGRRWKGACGNSLLETALILPLLLLVTFSIIEFGAMFYAYLALENGVSQATRYGITGNSQASLSRDDSIKAAMRDA